ncbi:putative ribonuclease BN [Mycolicibacterium tokaiense]|uniref:Putative ribonuclease BN n=1 Tax=Mycolicibacterium tokaiense TaxID=39695 RepID=A0A378TFS6_9MYCO|nr:ribonuclease [Mycolicibacterium tokaiense]STZ58663.1 putative ribonuclease BN [Mycolicibacterium tokaiense]
MQISSGQYQSQRPTVVRKARPSALLGAFVAGAASAVLAARRRSAARSAAEPASPRQEPAPPADAQRPEPDDPRKPDSPADLTTPSWRYVLKQTVGEFGRDQCTDLAAALTYYAVLSLFPALLVVVSLLGVIGQGQRTSDTLLDLIGDISPGAAAETLRQPIQQLVEAPSAGFALVVGLLAAVWSASGYVGAFGRAMNRIYEVDEGRPAVKLRLQQLMLTFASLIVVALVVLMLAVSGPVAEAVGGLLGAGDTAVSVWNIARWPVLLLLVILGVALLYHASPNVEQPRFRWLSVGAAIAIVVWVVASLGFGVYVANFGSYNKTFGALAGVIVFLLWLWITNLALLFGAELDAELERGRQLQAGIAAESDLQLPLRDTSAIEKTRASEHRTRMQGRKLRRTRGHRS